VCEGYQTAEEEAVTVVRGTRTYPLFEVLADLLIELKPLLKLL